MYKLIDYNEDIQLLYITETNHLFKLSADTANRLRRQELQEEEQAEMDYLKECEVFAPVNQETVRKAHYTDGENFTINVNLTNNCNLSCKYCFAQGGDYGTSQKDLMEADVLKDIEGMIARHVTHTRTVRIEFFGGEPLLNSAMIEQIYELCERIKREQGIQFIYRISTNLTVLPERILTIFKEGNFIVSVSIDGGEMTQNYNRPGKNGEGYYEKIIQNCIRVREASEDIILVARMTVYDNPVHLSKNIKTLQELNIYDYFQILPAFVPAKQEEPDQDKAKLWRDNTVDYQVTDTVFQEFAQFIDEYEKYFTKSNRFSGNLEFERIADIVVNKKAVNSYCSAGRTYLTLSPDRSLVPCHRLVGNDQFLLGYSDQDGLRGLESWNGQYLDQSVCSSCWGKYICGGGCKQQNYLRTGDMNKPDSSYCQEELMVIEKVLRSLYRQGQDYYERDRTLLDRLFISCGRPILQSARDRYRKLDQKRLKYFQWVV